MTRPLSAAVLATALLVAGGLTSVVIWLLFVKALGVVLPGGVLLERATAWL